jgi:hypothetical protein
MARQMQHEFSRYFGMATRLAYDHGASTLELDPSSAARASAWNEAMGRIRSRNRNPDLSDWGRARNRMYRALQEDLTISLQTTNGRSVLYGFLFEPLFGGIVANPFSWFYIPAGRRATGPDPLSWTRPIRASSPRAAAAMSPTLQLLHELDHKWGCMFGNGAACRGSTGNALVAEAYDAEEATVDDVDRAMAVHPDIASRGTYGRGHTGPNQIYELEGSSDEWTWIPNEVTLRHGTEPDWQHMPPSPRRTPPPPPQPAPEPTPEPAPRDRRRRSRRRTVARQAAPDPAALLDLQRTAGNRAVTRMLASFGQPVATRTPAMPPVRGQTTATPGTRRTGQGRATR